MFHLAMSRIEGRDGGVPKFGELREHFINEYGVNRAINEEVFKKWAPHYRLRRKEVDEKAAWQAVNARRPVVANWTRFKEFYKNEPTAVLKKEDFLASSSRESGHAVVLMKCDPVSLVP